MKHLLQVLLGHSIRDLFKHKSFFLLSFILILLDRALKNVSALDRSKLQVPEFTELSRDVAAYVFEQLPGLVLDLLTDYRTFVAVALLFLLKQLISMWPSSDMRRMHRAERESFGLIGSLVAITGRQVLWDAVAIGSVVGLTGAWALGAFLVTRPLWRAFETPASFGLLALLVSLSLPLAMAGFSFSSKLAVISRGTFGEKLSLFFKLFTDLNILAPSWLFFLLRIIIELVFVVTLPLLIFWLVDLYIIKILAAGLVATPFYSLLKMASFKFFLEVYRPFSLVRTEYDDYYGKVETASG